MYHPPSSSPGDHNPVEVPPLGAVYGVDEVASGRFDELVAAVSSLADQVDAEITTGRMTAQRARDLSAAAARLHHATELVQVLAAGAVDTTDARRLDASTTTRKWLARHNGLAHRDASRLVRVSSARRRFDRFDAAFRRQEVTLGHLDALAGIIPDRFRGEDRERAVEMVRSVEDVLVAQATESTVDEFTDLCRRVRARLDGDGPADRSAEPSRVWLTRLFNGRWALGGDLAADDGAILASLLQDAMDAQRAASRAGSHGPEAESAAPSADETASADEAASVDVVSERRAAALRDLLLAGAGANRPGRVGLMLHIELEDLNAPAGEPLADVMARLLDHDGVPHTDAGLDISDATLWGLMADAEVTPVFRYQGHNLFYGRSRRFAPAILRRVLNHRDRRCRWVGCDNGGSRREAHHIEHFEATPGHPPGLTDPRNCANLCLPNHHDHHDRRWGITGNAEGDLSITRPDGRIFDGTPAYRERRQPRDVSGPSTASGSPS